MVRTDASDGMRMRLCAHLLQAAVLEKSEPVYTQANNGRGLTWSPSNLLAETDASENPAMTIDRRNLALHNLNLSGVGLEVGPSHSPLAAGESGLDVRVLDFLDREGLIEKYRAEGVDTSKISRVDYVWQGEAYKDLVGEQRFDWVLASHVLEHVPDVVAFLNGCDEILADGGVISLIIPDKRCVFDHFRPPAGLQQILDAHIEKRIKPTVGTVVEAVAMAATRGGQITWFLESDGDLAIRHPEADASQLMQMAMQPGYNDVHVWAFTPMRLRAVLHDLWAMGILGVRELSFTGTIGCEFFLQLSRDGAGPELDREALYRAAALE
jgi:predicted SAM-dependent methyltransferase